MHIPLNYHILISAVVDQTKNGWVCFGQNKSISQVFSFRILIQALWTTDEENHSCSGKLKCDKGQEISEEFFLIFNYILQKYNEIFYLISAIASKKS